MPVVAVLEELDRHLVALLFHVNPQFHLSPCPRSMRRPSIGCQNVRMP